jgi:uncharacterized protein (UPF0264 family)
MTRLLVSVRNADEARAALEAGVDLIDLKEPGRGPLGAVDRAVVEAVSEFVDGRVPTSAALGELINWDPRVAAALPRGLELAKVGLAGCAEFADWPKHWETALAQLPTWVGSVAVVYADRHAARAPNALEVLDHGVRLGCRAVLVDTFDKSGPGLIDCWSPAKLRRFVTRVQQAGLWAVLAGSIRLAHLPQMMATRPDWIAVRGAVCRPSRDGRLDPALVRSFRSAMNWLPNVQIDERASAVERT